MAFTPKSWADSPSTSTPISAAALEDLESRLAAYAEGPTTVVSSLPGSPVDGQEVYYLADSTNGVIWHLKYRSGSSSSYKWEFVGGGSLSAEVPTLETTSSTTFVDLATVGPSVTLPLAGDYEISADAAIGSSAGGIQAGATIKLGTASASENEGFGCGLSGIGNPGVQMGRKMVRTGLASGSVLKMQYRIIAGSGTMLALRRELAVRPVRVG